MEPQKAQGGIELPQATMDVSHAWKGATDFFCLGGRAPSDTWVQDTLRLQPHVRLHAVDRGVAICRRLHLVPDFLIGDADSATNEDWAWGEAHARHVERHPVKKDLTDTQLALMYENEVTPCGRFLLTGAFGGRFDHAFSTIFSGAYTQTFCVLSDERETVAYLKDGECMTIHCHATPKAISLLPLTSEVTGVTTDGLYWSLKNATLLQELPTAVSNVLNAGTSTFTVSIQKGTLAIYICWDER